MAKTAKTFQDIVAWQKAHRLVLSIYELTQNFPKQEMFGLTSQFRRAAVSVPANIAEGFRRRGSVEKARFLNIAEASLEECRYYLILSRDLGYGDTTGQLAALEEVSRILYAYAEAVRSSIKKG